MGTPFLAEVKIMSFNFPPKGWAMCNGQLLPINQNQALFSLLGTTYGGNGQTNFALPDLRSRVPLHVGAGFSQGQLAGEENHTLNLAEMASHSHAPQGNTNIANSGAVTNNTWAPKTGNNLFSNTAPNANMNLQAIGNAGNNQAHNNLSPYLVLNFCIALQGIFPSRN